MIYKCHVLDSGRTMVDRVTHGLQWSITVGQSMFLMVAYVWRWWTKSPCVTCNSGGAIGFRSMLEEQPNLRRFEWVLVPPAGFRPWSVDLNFTVMLLPAPSSAGTFCLELSISRQLQGWRVWFWQLQPFRFRPLRPSTASEFWRLASCS